MGICVDTKASKDNGDIWYTIIMFIIAKGLIFMAHLDCHITNSAMFQKISKQIT